MFTDQRLVRLQVTASVAMYLRQHHPSMEVAKSTLLLAIETKYPFNLVYHNRLVLQTFRN